MTVKVTHWMILIYLMLLLVSSAVIPFISEDIPFKKRLDQKESDVLMDEMYANISRGNLEKIAPENLLKKEQFKIGENGKIHIVSNGEFGPQVFIEKQKEQNNNLEVFIYSTPLLIDGMDFTKNRRPYEIVLKDNNFIISPMMQNIKISIASDPFPVRQFTGESLFNHGSSSGDQKIYIKASSDIQFTADEAVILEWVN